MKAKNPILTSITGGVSSVVPILFAACKGGACVGVCVTPVASLFGISAAAIAASPIVSALEPILIAISAVSFTISYYSLYVISKADCGTDNSCGCGPSPAATRKEKISKLVFWLGLFLSIGFFSYFEYSKYQNSQEIALSSASCTAENGCGENTVGSASCGEESGACCAGEDSTTVAE